MCVNVVDVGEDTADGAGGEQQAAHANGAHAFVYGATCAGLAAWGRALGFDVILLGVAADPLAALRKLSLDGHGRGGMMIDDISEDALPWDDWVLSPVAGSLAHSEDLEPWGGTVRVRLPSGSGVAAFARRFAALMLPLEAARVAVSVPCARSRSERGAMPPAMPRFTREPNGWIPAGGLYRLSTASDAGYASRALAAAACSLLFAKHELDLIAGVEEIFGSCA